MMAGLGYAHKHYDKNTNMAGIGVFYKNDKYHCWESGLKVFNPKES